MDKKVMKMRASIYKNELNGQAPNSANGKERERVDNKAKEYTYSLSTFGHQSLKRTATETSKRRIK